MNSMLEVHNLKKDFTISTGLMKRAARVQAVAGVDFDISKGQTFGLVGESGCGKTTVGRLILRLIEPTSGEVMFDGENILSMSSQELRRFRTKAQLVFQNPFASLDPRKSVGHIVGDPLRLHRIVPENQVESRVANVLRQVGLDETASSRYPHEFSGGQRQRIAIARALALDPIFIVLDEPTSSLDVSVQAQILNNLRHLQETLGLTYLFISHNLSVIRHMSDQIAVMYLGKIVEIAEADDLFNMAAHPYTRALLSSVPTLNIHDKRIRIILSGDIPSPINPPIGCRFVTRCPYSRDLCKTEAPVLQQVGPRHTVACHSPP